MKCHKAGDEQWYVLFIWQDCASEMPCTRYLHNIIERNKILEHENKRDGNFVLWPLFHGIYFPKQNMHAPLLLDITNVMIFL
jgi:hypothetical protein